MCRIAGDLDKESRATEPSADIFESRKQLVIAHYNNDKNIDLDTPCEWRILARRSEEFHIEIVLVKLMKCAKNQVTSLSPTLLCLDGGSILKKICVFQ